MTKTLIFTATYNEKENIKFLIENLNKLNPLYDVVNSLQLKFKKYLIILLPKILRKSLKPAISHLPPGIYLEPITNANLSKRFIIFGISSGS